VDASLIVVAVSGIVLGVAVEHFRMARKAEFVGWDRVALKPDRAKIFEDKGFLPARGLAVQRQERFQVMAPNGLRCGEPGHWEIASLDRKEQDLGYRWALSDRDFQRSYVPDVGSR